MIRTIKSTTYEVNGVIYETKEEAEDVSLKLQLNEFMDDNLGECEQEFLDAVVEKLFQHKEEVFGMFEFLKTRPRPEEQKQERGYEEEPKQKFRANQRSKSQP